MDVPIEPGAGKGPVSFGGRRGDAEDFGGLFDGQSDEITKLEQFRLLFVLGGEFFQRFIESQQFVGLQGGGDLNLLTVKPLLAGAVA